MNKVVFNNNYGGFMLSTKAINWLHANCTDEELKKYFSLRNSLRGENYSNYEFDCTISDWFDRRRHHKDLVAVVEALGSEASGSCSNLAITEIEGKMYRIDVYDGWEQVITPKDNTDWILIE